LVNLHDPEKDIGKLVFLKKAVKVILSSSKKSPNGLNEEITFTAKDTGFHLPKYEFFLTRYIKAKFYPDIFLLFQQGERQVVQESSDTGTWRWFPEEEGYYSVEVVVVDEKEKAQTKFPFLIQKRAVDLSLMSSLKSPQDVNHEIVFAANFSGFVTPRFEFRLSRLKWVMQTSLVRTLAKKLKISTAQVYKRFKTSHRNEHGTYRVLEVRVEREAGKMPLIARFGGIPLRWNKWAAINDAPTKPIWSGRSEVVDRLLAQQCELCGATNNIEVHHIRKLADLKRYGQTDPPQWVQKMAARRRKTLVVCQDCHHTIQYGRYDGTKFSK